MRLLCLITFLQKFKERACSSKETERTLACNIQQRSLLLPLLVISLDRNNINNRHQFQSHIHTTSLAHKSSLRVLPLK